MRVTILSLGTLGDVAPFLGLGQGLARRGHAVTLATYGRYADQIAAAGLRHHVLPGDPARLLRSDSSRRIARAGTNVLSYLRGQRRQAEALAAKAQPLLQASRESCEDADLIVYALTALMGGSIAEALGRPAVQAFLTPVTPTRRFAGLLAPRERSRLGGLGNRASHYLAERALTGGFRGLLDSWRHDALGLAPLPGGPLAEARRRGRPLLYGISPTVLPPPDDWPDSVAVTGYWPPPPEPGWQPPPDLEAFLAAGEPPVCFGFGSMGEAEAERMTGLVLETIRRLGCRAVLLSGWGALKVVEEAGGLPSGVRQAESLPHAWLLPRVAAMVHAGGAGTSAAVFRAGVPAVVVPYSGDQFFWARRAEALGVAPSPQPWADLTAEGLARALGAVLTGPGYRDAARRLADSLAHEDGVAVAVAALERAAAGGRHA